MRFSFGYQPPRVSILEKPVAARKSEPPAKFDPREDYYACPMCKLVIGDWAGKESAFSGIRFCPDCLPEYEKIYLVSTDNPEEPTITTWDPLGQIRHLLECILERMS